MFKLEFSENGELADRKNNWVIHVKEKSLPIFAEFAYGGEKLFLSFKITKRLTFGRFCCYQACNKPRY